MRSNARTVTCPSPRTLDVSVKDYSRGSPQMKFCQTATFHTEDSVLHRMHYCAHMRPFLQECVTVSIGCHSIQTAPLSPGDAIPPSVCECKTKISEAAQACNQQLHSSPRFLSFKKEDGVTSYEGTVAPVACLLFKLMYIFRNILTHKCIKDWVRQSLGRWVKTGLSALQRKLRSSFKRWFDFFSPP